MKTTFTNEYRKPISYAVKTADIIAHVKEAEAKVEQLEARSKELIARLGDRDREIANLKANLAGAMNLAEQYKKLYETETNKLDHMTRAWKSERHELSETKEALARYRRRLHEEYRIGDALEQKNTLLARENNRLKEDVKILKKLAKDLFARLKSWQQMAKNQFRKNKVLEIEAIIKECEVDEAYDRIRKLEEDLAEKDVIIDEIIISAEEAAEEWAQATEEAESKAYKLAVELAEKDWLIKQYEEKDEAEKLWAEATSVGSILTVAKEIAAYEIEQVFIEAWPDRSVEKEIERQELNDEIICGLGYIKTEATEIESLWRVERICKEIDDILNNFSSLAE